MKYKIFAGAALSGVAFFLVAAQSGDSPSAQMSQLQQQLATLNARMANMEHAGGADHTQAQAAATGMSGGGGTGAAPVPSISAGPPPPVRTMVVDGIKPSDHVAHNTQEIDQLKRETDAMGDTLIDKRERLDRASGRAVSGGAGYGRSNNETSSSDRTAVDGRVISDRMIANQYATQLALKKRKLDRLQRANSMPKQIITGHDGTTIITLHSKFNLEEDLNDIDVNSVVTWTGHRTSMDAGSESWEIDSIHVVKAKK